MEWCDRRRERRERLSFDDVERLPAQDEVSVEEPFVPGLFDVPGSRNRKHVAFGRNAVLRDVEVAFHAGKSSICARGAASLLSDGRTLSRGRGARDDLAEEPSPGARREGEARALGEEAPSVPAEQADHDRDGRPDDLGDRPAADDDGEPGVREVVREAAQRGGAGIAAGGAVIVEEQDPVDEGGAARTAESGEDR